MLGELYNTIRDLKTKNIIILMYKELKLLRGCNMHTKLKYG